MNNLSSLRFSVTDTGIGIDQKGMEKLFKAFQQVDTPTRQYGGTGLGLVISKRLAKFMGGKQSGRKVNPDPDQLSFLPST